ncbi:MAG: hypothetical protein IPM54_20775 [Polyangiaceae bacterium]|nr:hypothetical protein [Polyangiaceae bacterium]
MTNPNRDGVSIDERVPAEVELCGIGLSFSLAAGKNLSRTWQRELRTESESRIRMGVTRERLEVCFSPPLLIDAQWPAMNMQLGGVIFDFSTSCATATVGAIHGATEGLVDFTEDAKKEVCALITSAIAGTAMATAGYNPMTDPHIVSTLEAIAANFRRQPSSGPPGVEYDDFGDPRIDMKMFTTTHFRHVEENAGLSVPKGTIIDVSIAGRGNLAKILASRSTAEQVTAAKIESVTISSAGILVIVNEKPCAFLDKIRIDRGAAVTLERMRLEGTAGEAAGIESLFRAVASAMNWSARGVPLDAGMALAVNSRDALATFVPDMARSKIEATLTEGVKQIVRASRFAIPEIDLQEIFLSH